MDTTEWVAGLYAGVPVHATLGIVLVEAEAGSGVVRIEVPRGLGNVVGALHSSGVVGLLDASGLAAVLSWCRDPADLDGVTPLGRAAQVRFLAPGRGTLLARTTLPASPALVDFWAAREPGRLRLATHTTVVDEAGDTVATGGFDWSLRRG